MADEADEAVEVEEVEEDAGEETSMLPVLLVLLVLLTELELELELELEPELEPESEPELLLVLEPSRTVRPPLAVAMASVECSWTKCSSRSGTSSVDHISALSCRTHCLC